MICRNGRYGHKQVLPFMHQVAPLDFDKRKGLMSLLESRNDVVRHDSQWRYKFIVNVFTV
jgi:hypothetical protein